MSSPEPASASPAPASHPAALPGLSRAPLSSRPSRVAAPLGPPSFDGPLLRAQGTRALAEPAPAVFCYSIQAAAEPGTLPRVLGLFAKRGLVPSRLHVDLVAPPNGAGGSELAIDLQVSGLGPPEQAAETARLIAAALRQLCAVESVLTSEKS